jgi:hypothetical protein
MNTKHDFDLWWQRRKVTVNNKNIVMNTIQEKENTPPAPGLAAAGRKICRPPNAYIIFSKEFRKVVAAAHPEDSNILISQLLGAIWKALPQAEKNIYYEKAKKPEADHLAKYPSYVYCPNEARRQKSLRAEARALKKSRQVNAAARTQATATVTAAATAANQELPDLFTRYEDLFSFLLNDGNFEFDVNMFL